MVDERNYCPACEAEVTEADEEAGACTQCGFELKGEDDDVAMGQR